MAKHTRVALELGKTWVFATALDWPGWCRRGKGEEAALQALDEYAARYRATAGTPFKPGPYEVLGRVRSDMHADFGAPGIAGPWDEEPLTSKEKDRLIGLLEAGWTAFDTVVAGAPAQLAKLDFLRSGDTGKWPPRYAINRIAWHVTDHLWEIEDKS